MFVNLCFLWSLWLLLTFAPYCHRYNIFLFFCYKSQPKSEPKTLTLKKELINLAFLDLLGNHIQSIGFSNSIVRYIARFIACFIACFITVPKIYGFYKAPGLEVRISRVKYRKSFDNTLSRDNLNIRIAIYIIKRCLALGLRY